MKLEELMEDRRKQERGTYAGVRFDTATVDAIEKYMKDNDIPKAVSGDKLHTTLLYSRKYLPDYKATGKLTPHLIGTPTEFVVWKTSGDDGKEPANCLVLMYSCPALVKRHKELMKEYDATYDFDEYKTHITLSYDIGDLDIKTLPEIKKTIKSIVIVEEYQEDLNLSWAHKAHK